MSSFQVAVVWKKIGRKKNLAQFFFDALLFFSLFFSLSLFIIPFFLLLFGALCLQPYISSFIVLATHLQCLDLSFAPFLAPTS